MSDDDYELSANDFKAIASALSSHIRTIAPLFDAAYKSDPHSTAASDLAKQLNDARHIQTKFDEAFTAWIQPND